MLGSLTELLPARSRCVLVDGPAEQAELFAARLAGQLAGQQRTRYVRVTRDADGAWDVAVFLRTAPGGRHFPVYRKDGKTVKNRAIVAAASARSAPTSLIDLHDVHWPVIRRVAAPLAARPGT